VKGVKHRRGEKLKATENGKFLKVFDLSETAYMRLKITAEKRAEKW